MVTLDVADRLEPLGMIAGVLLVVFGLGTLFGQPWATKSLPVVLLQIVGVLAMIALGAGLVWIARTA